jgi:hypothetical protein
LALAQQRNVLEAVLDRRRTRNHWAKLLLRPTVVVGLLLGAGVTVAMVGRARLARHALPDQASRAPRPAQPIGIRPADLAQSAPSGSRSPDIDVEAEAPPLKRPSTMSVRSTARPAQTARPHDAPAVEDPAYVGEALRVLRTDRDPARALRLLDKYLKAYPQGMLSEEALALSIEAAMDLGSPNAVAFARRYLKEYPNGRFRDAANQALGQRPR